MHARPQPLYKYVRASCKHVPHASALFSNQTISCIHAALLACVFFLLNRPSVSAALYSSTSHRRVTVLLLCALLFAAWACVAAETQLMACLMAIVLQRRLKA